MPTYQYACTECGHELEAFQSFTDDALTLCPLCQGKLRKVYGSVGVVFKGSGFYRNDSRASNSESLNPVKKDSAAAKDSGSTGSDSSQSKPSTPASTPAASSSGNTSSGSSSNGGNSGGSSSGGKSSGGKSSAGKSSATPKAASN